jgi:hypothetical protein
MKLQATDARQAFPCWDEPAVKATFDVTLVGPKDRVILSNMVSMYFELNSVKFSFKNDYICITDMNFSRVLHFIFWQCLESKLFTHQPYIYKIYLSE